MTPPTDLSAEEHAIRLGGPVRTLRVKGGHGRWLKRTPAMAAG